MSTSINTWHCSWKVVVISSLQKSRWSCKFVSFAPKMLLSSNVSKIDQKEWNWYFKIHVTVHIQAAAVLNFKG